MRTATLLGKGISGDAAACNAQNAIEMATINGARALGQADRIGSIEVGKCADLIAVNLAHLNTQPVYDPVAQLVYAAASHQVSDVWINGKAQLRNYQFCEIDQAEIIAKANAWADKIRSA